MGAADKWLLPLVSISLMLFLSALSGFPASSALFVRLPPPSYVRRPGCGRVQEHRRRRPPRRGNPHGLLRPCGHPPRRRRPAPVGRLVGLVRHAPRRRLPPRHPKRISHYMPAEAFLRR